CIMEKMQQATKDKKDGTTATKLSWTHQMDNAFIEAMLKEKENGNKLDGSFTSQAYMNMVEELSKSLKMEIRKVHLQNRLKTLKAHFSLYNDIFRGVSLSGFSWDPITKLMNAEDEVWEALIKEKPEAAKLRTKPIRHYNEMLELFAKDRATGEGAVTAKERNNRIKQNEQTTETIDELDETDQLFENNDTGLENFNDCDDVQVTSEVKAPTKITPKSKKRKLEEDDVFISKITSSLDNISSAIDRSTKVMENSRPHVYSEAEIYKVLELMGLERHEIPSAYLFLVDNPDKTRALFGAPNEMRLTILATMMA
ncbi:Myb/SANT-like domain-containing protein, partial [Tanacetum coccineum]